MQSIVSYSWVVVAAALIQSCSTPEAVKTVSREEQLQRDYMLGNQLAQRVEAELKFRESPGIVAYLEKVGQRILEKMERYSGTELEIRIVEDGEHWKNYALPGVHLYLSKSLLKRVRYENELAGVIALELAHVEMRHQVSQAERFLADSKSLQLTHGDGIFNYSDDNIIDSLDLAVRLLYTLEYDPRGLINVWSIFEKNPDRSPYTSKQLGKFLRSTRDSVASLSPLRNPVVRTNEFIAIWRQMMSLE